MLAKPPEPITTVPFEPFATLLFCPTTVALLELVMTQAGPSTAPLKEFEPEALSPTTVLELAVRKAPPLVTSNVPTLSAPVIGVDPFSLKKLAGLTERVIVDAPDVSCRSALLAKPLIVREGPVVVTGNASPPVLVSIVGAGGGGMIGRAHTALPLPSATGELPATGLITIPVIGSRATCANTYWLMSDIKERYGCHFIMLNFIRGTAHALPSCILLVGAKHVVIAYNH